MKLIRKTYNGVVPNGKVLNKNSSSVTDTYSCDYINNNIDRLHTYSEEEIKIGTWLGKPLYRKVVTGTLGTPNINSNTWNNLTNNASELVNVYGTVAGRPYNNTIVLKDNSYVLALDVAIANNTIMYRNLGLPENSVFTLTIEYTKTTD